MLMYSASNGLLAETVGDQYHVFNGGWMGIRDGDNFTIHGPGRERRTVTITDWKQVTAEEMRKIDGFGSYV